jgi:hypothetical protein
MGNKGKKRTRSENSVHAEEPSTSVAEDGSIEPTNKNFGSKKSKKREREQTGTKQEMGSSTENRKDESEIESGSDVTGESLKESGTTSLSKPGKRKVVYSSTHESVFGEETADTRNVVRWCHDFLGVDIGDSVTKVQLVGAANAWWDIQEKGACIKKLQKLGGYPDESELLKTDLNVLNSWVEEANRLEARKAMRRTSENVVSLADDHPKPTQVRSTLASLSCSSTTPDRSVRGLRRYGTFPLKTLKLPAKLSRTGASDDSEEELVSTSESDSDSDVGRKRKSKSERAKRKCARNLSSWAERFGKEMNQPDVLIGPDLIKELHLEKRRAVLDSIKDPQTGLTVEQVTLFGHLTPDNYKEIRIGVVTQYADKAAVSKSSEYEKVAGARIMEKAARNMRYSETDFWLAQDEAADALEERYQQLAVDDGLGVEEWKRSFKSDLKWHDYVALLRVYLSRRLNTNPGSHIRDIAHLVAVDTHIRTAIGNKDLDCNYVQIKNKLNHVLDLATSPIAGRVKHEEKEDSGYAKVGFPLNAGKHKAVTSVARIGAITAPADPTKQLGHLSREHVKTCDDKFGHAKYCGFFQRGSCKKGRECERVDTHKCPKCDDANHGVMKCTQ